VAPLLAVLCLTGLVYAFTPQLDELVYKHELSVPVGSAQRPLADQLAAVHREYPQGTVLSVDPPAAPGKTTAVVLAAPGDADRTVYVDPYRAIVRGELSTVNGRPPLQQWLRDLHGNLHGGTVGRWYSEAAASWLPVLVLGGLILWFGGRGDRRIRPTGRRPGRARARAWHGSLGIWLSVGLLGISVTGLTWSHYAGDRFGRAVTVLNGRTPQLIPPPVSGERPLAPDSALAAAQRVGLRSPLSITLPTGRTASYTVAETSQSWPIRRDTVSVDPYSGRITGRLDYANFPVLAKLTTLGIELHQGTLFGLANAVALALFAVATLALLGCGYRMWWLRRRVMPARGAWRRVPFPVLLVVLVCATALAWVLPVLGVTLLVFVAVDVVLGRGGPLPAAVRSRSAAAVARMRRPAR
jgi:uncharacterized iron-regulated membrane protein